MERWEKILLWIGVVFAVGGVLTAGVTTIISLLLLVIYFLVSKYILIPKGREEYKATLEALGMTDTEEYERTVESNDTGQSVPRTSAYKYSDSARDNTYQDIRDELQESFDHELEEVKAMWCRGEIDSADISEALDELKDDIEKRSIEIDAKFGINRKPADSQT